MIFIYCIDLCITYPFLTGLIYMLQKYALKVETFETKFELLIFSFDCMFIHSPLFENNKKRPYKNMKSLGYTYTCKIFI